MTMLFNKVIGEKEKCLIFKLNELSGKPIVSILRTHTQKKEQKLRDVKRLPEATHY